ncbi:Ig-like domain-containing protein [Schumannella luteola]
MIRQWLSTHRSLVASATSGTVIAALVAGIAIASTGYTAQRIDLGDGSVWVANNAQQAIGRANTEVLELNSVVPTTGSDLEVLQEGATVLLVDRTEARIEIIDAATSESLESVALPPNQPQVLLAGSTVVIFEAGTGELWIVPEDELESFDSQAPSTLSLGSDAIVSLDPAGLLVAYAPTAGLLYRLDTRTTGAAASSSAVSFAGDGVGMSITSVSGQWVVFDPAERIVYTEGGAVDLSDAIATGADARLQEPSTEGSRVLLGYSGGLLGIPLDGGSPVELASGTSGLTAAPFVLDGCEYAAWTSGQSWRRCSSDSPAGTTLALESVAATASLAFASNGTRAVLNDRRTGETWAVQRDGELIDNWDDLIAPDDENTDDQQPEEDVPTEVEKVQQPPVAVDDSFGARPGRSTVLPVLLNDYDPNGDVLVISALTPLDESIGRIDLITQRQQIQLTLSPQATGQVSFGYTITDGRGGSASATVTVSIRTADQNGPPEQVRSTTATVQTGGRVSTDVLGDWVDPDGDAFYLTSATIAAPDTVTYKPGGTVVFSDSGEGGDLKLVTLVVSDGSAQASGTLSVSVRGVGDVPIIPEPFVLQAYAGEEITVSPLEHVRGGSGTIRLNSVPSRAGFTVTPSYEAGTFRFISDEVRSHYLEYVVTDGTQTATGVVRIDVSAPPDANTKPITVPKTVFVQTLRNERIDVAGTDVDPAGGVLLVTGVMNLPEGSGVRAEVLEQRLVRVSLEAPLDNGPVTFNYRISNGLAEAEGVITVIEIPTPSRIQPPIAEDDSVTVRVGEAIDIPVLRNDEHPDGLALTLQPRLAQELPDDSGLLFASGSQLRYLAPNRTGNFTAAYQVTGPDGQAATALVRIAVREADAATNNPPVPPTVTARVLAGESVRIRIPITGIDPDGDSVQLLGQSSNPDKGAVIETTADTIVYQAGDYSAGTDTFSYTVIDALGARATGTIRVGISPRLDGARNPVAIVDEVTVRPGVTVSVQVLANDSDPDGSPLTIVSAEPNDDETTAEIVGDVVRVTPPREPGNYGVIYSIENDSGGTSQNFIRVTVSEDAPLAYPLASDTVLTLSDILDRDTVVVDVLANVFFADGDPRSLGLSIYPGYGDAAQVTSNKRVEVTISDRSQIIPFKVTHPEDPGVFSYAFIRVPGFDDALPQLDRRAPALRVTSEDDLVIDLNDYVIAVGGKRVQLTDSSTVQATHANGDDLVVDSDTLVFTSAEKYFGPASISFEVTDGTSPTDPEGRTATLVLPITVLPRDNQPPAFGGAVLDFEPGQEKVIDLLRLTNYPYPDDLDELAYSVLTPLPTGFTYALNGSTLTLRADESAVKGTTTSMTLGVRDDLVEGKAGRIELRIVSSTRPLVRPAADTAIAKRGATTTVDVLANDQATNPFPGQALRVVDIRGIDGASLPPGIAVEPSADNSSLTVTVASSASPGDVRFQYQVADATDDPARYAWGTITVSVQDRPDPITNLSPSSFGDQQLTMRWNAGQFNNSPITGYRVTTTAGGSTTGTTMCPGTTCVIATPGNGPANAVRVTVVAINAIGESDPVTFGEQIWSDVIPAAPTGLSAQPLDHGLRISWDRVPNPANGSAVSSYVVSAGGISATVGCSAAVCSTDIVDGSLTNGVATNFSVSARNDAYGPLATWNSSSGQATPAGPPIAVSAPLATAVSDTQISLSWPGAFSDNGRPITAYTAAAYTGAVPTCAPDGTVSPNGATVQSVGTATSATFSGLAANAEYSFIVFAANSQGCTASTSVLAQTKPGVITALSANPPSANGEVYDFTLASADMGGTPFTSDFFLYYRVNGGSEQGPVSLGGFLAAEPLQYGTTISVTVRACRTYSGQALCQDSPSAPFTLGVPVDPRATGILFVQDDPDDPFNSGTFSFSGWPSGEYQDVQFACGTAPGEGSFSTIVGPSPTCHVDAVPSQTPYLTIRVIANGGQVYDVSYNGFDYD